MNARHALSRDVTRRAAGEPRANSANSFVPCTAERVLRAAVNELAEAIGAHAVATILERLAREQRSASAFVAIIEAEQGNA